MLEVHFREVEGCVETLVWIEVLRSEPSRALMREAEVIKLLMFFSLSF